MREATARHRSRGQSGGGVFCRASLERLSVGSEQTTVNSVQQDPAGFDSQIFCYIEFLLHDSFQDTSTLADW